MDKKIGGIIKFLVSLCLAAVLLYIACRGIEWGEFLDGLRTTRVGWLAMFVLASFSALLFRTLRWLQLLRLQDPGIRFGRVWDATAMGALSSIAIPASGEFVRAGLVTSDTVHYEKSLGIVIMERAWDLISITLLFLAALFTGWSRFGQFFIGRIWRPVTGNTTLLIIVSGLIVLVVAVLLLTYRLKDKNAFTAKIYSVVDGFVTGFISFKDLRGKGRFLFFTLCIWISYMSMTFLVIKSMPALDGLGVGDAIFVSAIGNLASVVPVPGGIGAYHTLVKALLMGLYGVSGETGLLFATLNHELHAFFVIILGSLSYFNRIVIMKNRGRERKN